MDSRNSIADNADTNISYFVGVDASFHSPGSILAGDRHLQVGENPVKAGLFAVVANTSLSWSKELHSSQNGGNISFIDGHVEFVNPKKLNFVFKKQNLPNARLAVP